MGYFYEPVPEYNTKGVVENVFVWRVEMLAWKSLEDRAGQSAGI